MYALSVPHPAEGPDLDHACREKIKDAILDVMQRPSVEAEVTQREILARLRTRRLAGHNCEVLVKYGTSGGAHVIVVNTIVDTVEVLVEPKGIDSVEY